MGLGKNMEADEKGKPKKRDGPGKNKPPWRDISQLADANSAGRDKKSYRNSNISKPLSHITIGGRRRVVYQRQFKLKPALPTQQGPHFLTVFFAFMGFNLLTMAFATIRHSSALH